jgi:dTDP-4-amino-4,6-dideoxygalactose transaminase
MNFLPFTRPTIDEDTITGVVEVLRSGWITSGPKLLEFEQRLSDYFSGRTVRCFNSGTCTLEIALRLAGIGAGDEVITTPLSWVATSNVILAVGARPVFVDVDPETRNLDLRWVSAAMTARTKAIMPVDLAGLPVDRDALYQLVKQHQLRVIEDAAQSLGSSWRGQRIGACGDFVSFSFHANKNLTTIEGGCLVMPEQYAPLAEKMRLQGVSRHGMDGMEVDVLGGKFNLSDVAARVGLGQLPHLEAFTQRRRELAQHYFTCFDRAKLESWGVTLPVRDFAQSNWHMFQIVLPPTLVRATFMQAMKEQGIGTGVHYPAIPGFALYRARGYRVQDYPVAQRIAQSIVTLPLFPTMQHTDVERVVATTMKTLQYSAQSL